ncbi:hypothetical protein [Synechococcus sp. PCC 7336]|uniref:hypothetical protein n=1 Tax=Synechococcus sp. PCC 7336 TaxID=195250 RepID=UPI00034DD31B|nr:hypothetical protein [Synechococcus sp. PCC 7336]
MPEDPNSPDAPRSDRNESAARRPQPDSEGDRQASNRPNSDRPNRDRAEAGDRRPRNPNPDERETQPSSDRPSRPTSARSIAASQALVSNPRPPAETGRSRSRSRAYDGDRRRYAPPSRTERERYGGASREYSRERGYDSGREYGRGDGGFSGGGGGPAGAAQPQQRKPVGGLPLLIAVGIVAFFIGFAMRDFYTAEGGFDDERPIQAELVPPNLREFCFAYNGLPSFTLITVASTSALSTSSVPVLKLDTCTIPTNQTANALQALGVDRRATSLGLQLGGSNVTLIDLPLTGSLAAQIYGRFPSLADSLEGRDREQKVKALETVLDEMLRSGANGLALQNTIKTNMTDVYAITPGHTFQLQPRIQSSEQ